MPHSLYTFYHDNVFIKISDNHICHYTYIVIFYFEQILCDTYIAGFKMVGI